MESLPIINQPPRKTGLWADAKFRWLIFSVAVVAVFEFLSLSGWHLPPRIGAPFFAAIILAVGWRTLIHGLQALSRLNFKSIKLLMVIAVAGAFYLGQYEEAAVVIVLFALGERLEEFGIQTSKSALQALVDRTPKTATVKSEGGTKEIPVAEVAVGNASSRGALVKGGKYIEAIGRVRAVAMDKTRTLTYGRPKVTDVLPFGESTREHLLACAAGIESYSEHPLAQSIVEAARAENVTLHEAENFEAVLGKGVKADCVVCYDKHHCVGKLPFITEEHQAQAEVVARVDALQREGKTSIVISNDREVEGVIAVTDELKPESREAVAELTRLGVEVVMLTGDNHAPARVVAEQVGIREVKAEMLPEDKAEAVRELTARYDAVAMVGDGVNDAPALALSSVGLAMGAAGSDTAIEAASIAILNDRLELIPYLIRLGRRAVATIKINTALAIATKLVFVGLAIAGLSNLALAIFADVGVTVLVILNSLRLVTHST